jgi:hypothetical protein
MLTRKSIPAFLSALLCTLPVIPSLAQTNKRFFEVVVLDQEGG